ncbi:hypothetical protein V8C40DRAFT_280724 [Trichoderma camerunense]
MDTWRITPFDCFIYCDTVDETKEILNKLKSFEGYEIRREKVRREDERLIVTIFTGSDNEDSTWVESDDGKMIPKQYSNLHEFLVKRGFRMTPSAWGTLQYEDKRRELVEVLEILNTGYIITELTCQRVQMDSPKVEGPQTEPQRYKFLCNVLDEHGFKPRSSGRNPREFIQSGSSWTEELLCVILESSSLDHTNALI